MVGNGQAFKPSANFFYPLCIEYRKASGIYRRTECPSGRASQSARGLARAVEPEALPAPADAPRNVGGAN